MNPLTPSPFRGSRRAGQHRSHRSLRGLTLVELMVAIVLGLLILGGVIAVFLSNREAFRTTEQLARVQENARTAFELMARSIREAGGSPCGRNLPTANVLNNTATTWWAQWGEGLRGYGGSDEFPVKGFGTGHAERVPGTEAIVILYGDSNSAVPVVSHNPTSAEFKVGSIAHGVKDGDVLLVCDYKQAAIFQATNSNSSNVTIVHNTGNARSPGNCTKGLGLPVVCSAVGTQYEFQGGQLMKLAAEAWYIGNFTRADGRTGRSLFRARLDSAATVQVEEIVEGVEDMEVAFLSSSGTTLATDYVPPAGVIDWNSVVSVRLTLTFQGSERVGTDGQALRRQSIHVIGLRNRLS
ncbi:PilW family protein [Caldimonas aquatica]|uniref:PilW family protein n=1 Tax=Caldimonas aquatica TaxID=376175 RepID=A0ABY6MPN4_9BURK|nr:PilW family protein [Schlegelella aquatica]UZD54084.1 PilW family protein [Schlegelella aquatica]